MRLCEREQRAAGEDANARREASGSSIYSTTYTLVHGAVDWKVEAIEPRGAHRLRVPCPCCAANLTYCTLCLLRGASP